MDRGFSPSGSQVSALIDSNPRRHVFDLADALVDRRRRRPTRRSQFQVAGEQLRRRSVQLRRSRRHRRARSSPPAARRSAAVQRQALSEVQGLSWRRPTARSDADAQRRHRLLHGRRPPDLALTKSDGGASVAPGGTVAYTLTYANSGDPDATGVVLTETVPANTTFNAGASTAGWVCAPNNNAGSTCTLAIGALAASGGSQTATFAVTVVNPVAAGVTQISQHREHRRRRHQRRRSDAGQQHRQRHDAGHRGSRSRRSPRATAEHRSVPGGTVAYTLTYANAGNRGAPGWCSPRRCPRTRRSTPARAPPAGSARRTTTPARPARSRSAASPPAAATRRRRSRSPSTTRCRPASRRSRNTASIADDGTNGTDPTPGNNTGSDTTPVGCAGLLLHRQAVPPARHPEPVRPLRWAEPRSRPRAHLRRRGSVRRAGVGAKARLHCNVNRDQGQAHGLLEDLLLTGISQPLDLGGQLSAARHAQTRIVSLEGNGDLVVLCGQSSGDRRRHRRHQRLLPRAVELLALPREFDEVRRLGVVIGSARRREIRIGFARARLDSRRVGETARRCDSEGAR